MMLWASVSSLVALLLLLCVAAYLFCAATALVVLLLRSPFISVFLVCLVDSSFESRDDLQSFGTLKTCCLLSVLEQWPLEVGWNLLNR